MAKKVDDRFLSVSEVADYLGCDRITVQNMLRDGRLKAYTLGTRMLRIRLSDIESALQPYGGVTIMPRVKEEAPGGESGAAQQESATHANSAKLFRRVAYQANRLPQADQYSQ